MRVRSIGPGPGAYLLPTQVGYSNHDATKYRNPQYSMGVKSGIVKKIIGPGPRYDLDHLTRFGKTSPPAFSMKFRHKDLTKFQTPGPPAYRVESVLPMKEARPPKYSMVFKHPPFKQFQTPGPANYEVPTTIGPKVPDKNANAAYSMSFKHKLTTKEISPGPARYDGVPPAVYKLKYPAYSMSPRTPVITSKMQNPGPGAYYPKLSKKSGYSFGTKTEIEPYITADDHIPCVKPRVSC